MRLYKLSWILWIAGTILVVGSWVGFVSVSVGWFGWCIALLGTILSFASRSQRKTYLVPVQQTSPAEEISKLDLLRKEGIISEEEFLREKARLLARS